MRKVLLLTSLLTLLSCVSGPVEEIQNGVIIRTEDQLVRLTVEADNIIRVSATAEKKFSDPKSLIIVPHDTNVDYELTQNEDTVWLTTNSIKAQVLINTGEICFYDLNGNVILQEQEGGGKEFKPYSVTQTRPQSGNWDFEKQEGNLKAKDITYTGWTTRAVFESPDDEAFFGLVQHKADEWNYKGNNE